MFLASAVSAITTLATTLVSGDREVDTASTQAPAQAQSAGQAVYARGQSEFAQTLEKVQADPKVLDALQQAGQLVTVDPSLTALFQASSPQATTQLQEQLTSPTPAVNPMAAVQNALQSGGAQLYQAQRLGLHLNTLG